MDEQMIADIAKALQQSEAKLFGYVGKDELVDGLWRNNERRYLREARAAHSVIAGKVAELIEQRDALRSELEHERASRMHWQVRAALAPYPERRSE